MGLTLYASVKAYLEAQGLGIAVYRDAAPEGATRPYVIFTGDITLGLEVLEDGVATTGTEQIQLDLYETWRVNSDVTGESPTLANAITQKIQGTSLVFGAAGTRVYGLLQRDRRRQVDKNQRTVRHIYQVDVVRAI